MAELFLLGLEVFFGVGTGGYLAGHTLDHLNAGALQGFDLLGIVGEQAHFVDSEPFEHLAGKRKVALVGLEAQPLIGFDGVETRVLQLVSLQFGHQPDAASFLLFVDKYARAQIANHGERHLELLAAVTAQRMKNIAGKTLRMDANQRRSGLNISHHQGDGFLDAPVSIGTEFGAKTMDAELTPASGKVRSC